jgi:uncharacterized membrane protein
MNAPRTINEYLHQLKAALRGADPALVQDALYDAEEHLRAELAEQPGRSEAEMLAHVVGSYGAPDEVAELYRDQEIRIQRALRPPPPPKRRSLAGRFFGVAADPRTYGALFYMVLALATGIFYFTWVVTGVSLSAGFSVLIIGLPFIVLFFGSVRVLSLVEGRIVEAMLGARMPRRPPYPAQQLTLMKRIGAMFTDGRTWTTLLYMLLMLPLGIVYFVVAVTGLAVSLGISAGSIYSLITNDASHIHVDEVPWLEHLLHTAPGLILFALLGLLMFFLVLHVARGIGWLHGRIAEVLLVRL